MKEGHSVVGVDKQVIFKIRQNQQFVQSDILNITRTRKNEKLITGSQSQSKIEFSSFSVYFFFSEKITASPLRVIRYFWVGLFGESGWVISTNPSSIAGLR